MNGANAAGGMSPWDVQIQAAAGNPNGGQNLKDVIAAHEWLRRNSPAIPYGTTGRVGGYQAIRVQQWMDATGWDGDLSWPPAPQPRQPFGPSSMEYKNPYDYGYDAHMKKCQEPKARAHAEGMEGLKESKELLYSNRAARDQERKEKVQHQRDMQMQKARFDHKKKTRQMDIDAQKGRGGR